MGPKEVEFGIHKSLLCHVSSYFQAALTGSFKEATEGVIHLPDEKLDIFKRFNEWLYTHVIISQEDISKPSWTPLLALYVFAEKRGIPSLQNSVIDAMITLRARTGSLPCLAVEYAWQNTSEKSGLHCLLVDLYTHIKSKEGLRDKLDRLYAVKQFVLEVVVSFYEAKKDGTVLKMSDFWTNRCQYHIHQPDDPPCTGPLPLQPDIKPLPEQSSAQS